ncbi:MAG: serine/threonine protein kinase [Candidatus Aminicenantes bacterium]|nr:MAG: serine/threonine protein kinase [Candidatus Aminicenantes bacterium]
MKCPQCQTENPSESEFCSKCGMQLMPSPDIPVTKTETVLNPKEELTIGSMFAGRYQIIEELGRGGMGSVYKVLDTELGEKVALKLLKPEIASDNLVIERFRNELKFARKITHKHVCRMFHLGRYENTPYITMEFVSGEDLKSTLRRVGHLSIGKTVYIAKQACEGLAEAHKLGVVHRDLKPQNIMIDKKGHTHIMDFGIARSLKTKGVTTAGMIIGTPDYMSPEQVEGVQVDHRADIYAMGVILYEMLTGDLPFEGKTPLSVALKHKTEIPREPKEFNPQIPDELNQLVMRCLEKKREKRFQNTAEILNELTGIEKNIPTKEMILEGKKTIFWAFLRKLKERKIIHTVVVFIGGGAALIEFAHHILVGHYHLPKHVVDYIIVTLILAMLLTVSWQWFHGEEAVRRKSRRLRKAKFQRIAALIAFALLIAVAAWQFTPLPEILGISPSSAGLSTEDSVQTASPEEKKISEPVAAEKPETKETKPEPEKKTPPKLEKAESKPEVSSMLNQGIQAFNQGNFDECIKRMEEVLKIDPENTSAQYFLSEAKNKKSEKAQEQEINEKLKIAQDAFQKGDYRQCAEQVQEVLKLDPQNAQARRLMSQIRMRMAQQQAKALVIEYVQSINSKNLVAFYEKACVPQLFQRLKQKTESSMSMFESFQSTASDVNIQFRGLNQAEISFSNIIAGVSKNGLKQEFFSGQVIWRVRRAGDTWKIWNITSTPKEKKQISQNIQTDSLS